MEETNIWTCKLIKKIKRVQHFLIINQVWILLKLKTNLTFKIRKKVSLGIQDPYPGFVNILNILIFQSA